MKKIEIVYPSFSKKALTFTIDDGNMEYDAKLLDILKPVGIKGTFNLCSNISAGNEKGAVDFYRGYEIANHSKYHPLVQRDGVEYVISDDSFDASTADENKIYRVEGLEGFYWIRMPNGWRQIVSEEDFLKYINEGKSELNEMFGEGSVRDYVWPYGKQDNLAAHELIRNTHRSARITGCTFDTTKFAIPKDKYAWSYNANDENLLEVMEKYDKYADDGELKFFAFGVHSIDFEKHGTWDDLRVFAEKYGGRPETYWYAAVGEIFDYDEAVTSLEINADTVTNHSDIPVYLKVDGARVTVEPHTKISV